MPEPIHNRWTVRLNATGTPEDLKAFLKLMTTDTLIDGRIRYEMTFVKIRPIPKVFIRMNTFTITDPHGNPVARKPLKEEAQQIKETGAEDLGDWLEQNWGTTDDATDSKIHLHGSGENPELRIQFQTPGEPPAPIINAVCRQFPQLLFIVSYESASERAQRLAESPEIAPEAPGVH